MANGYDGDVKLGVELSLEDVTSQSKKLSSAVSKALDNIDTSKLDKGTKKLVDNLTKAETEVKKVETEVERLGDKIAQAEDYQLDLRTVNKALDEYRGKLAELFEERKKLADQKVPTTDERWKAVADEIKKVQEYVKYYEERLDELQNHPIVADEELNKVEQLTNKWEELNSKRRTTLEALSKETSGSLDSILSNFGSVGTFFKDTSSAVSMVAGAFSKVGIAIAAVKTALNAVKKVIDTIIALFKKMVSVAVNTMTTIAQTTQKVTDGFLRLAGLGPVIDGIKTKVSGLLSKFKSATSSASNFGQVLQNGVKKFLAYGLGIASLTALFSKLRSSITSGLQSMAKMNNGMNQTNAMMTQLTSSLNLLKGALATAFVPILTTVSPILSSFMQQLANVITFIGMMIAKLTGAKSYMKATFKSTDYASSAGGGGSKGKTAQQKYDEAVKKAQEKYDKKVSETEAKNAERMAKAEEKQAKAADKLAKKQEKANNKLAAFDDLNVLGVDTLEDLQDIEADLLEMPELELPNLEDFTGGGGGGKDPFGLEEVPLDDFEWNWDDLLKKARELGEKLAEFLNDIFADKDLAKKIGNTIGNLINLAINFAYGFVSKFKFRQFGQWLGTLLQEAIETIDWALLGETIGKGINGIADTIIGFFEGYDVGTLGASIAEMFNNAIHEVDPQLIGEAYADVLKAPLIEISKFLTEADWKEVATKLSQFIKKVFESDELNGETLGQTVGNFVQSIVDSINEFFSGWETGTLGSSIAKFISDAIGQLKPEDFAEATYTAVNTVATEIKNFFDGLPAEELAVKIATWINNSVKGVDANEVAEALKSMLKTAFNLIATLFNNTDFEEIGKKIGEIITNVFSTEEGDTDLADAASSMIAAVVNAGLRLLDGLEDAGAIDALKSWIWEVIKQAIDKIDTEWIAHKLWQLLVDATLELSSMTIPGFGLLFDSEAFKQLDEMADKLDDLNWKLEHGKITVDEYKQQYKELTGIVPEVTGSFQNLDGQVEGLANHFADGKQKTEEFAQTNIEKAPEVRDAWTDAQQPLKDFNAEIDTTGFKLDTELPSHVDGAKQYLINAFGEAGNAAEEFEVKGTTHIHNNETAWEELAIAVDGTTQTIKNNTDGIDEATNTSAQTIDTYKENTFTALDGIQSKFQNVALDFTGFTTQIQTTLETLTTQVDTWYQDMMLKYFSYDAWMLVLQEGMLLAFTDFFTTIFIVEFDTQMQTFWDEYVLKWFTTEWWQEQIYTPWYTYFNTKWQAFLTKWDSNMNIWWTNHVQPWFKEAKWEKEFMQVYKVAEKVGNKTRDKIKELADETAEAVHSACEAMKSWIQEIIEMLGEAIELAEELASYAGSGGGGGSSSGSRSSSGGSNGGGGGGRYSSFMPMLDVMHFEDNLNMSAFKFPELATGAVIPPNNKFLAVLGDQKSGMNIETPLATMVEAFRNVMDEYMTPGYRNATMEVDGETFARLMMPHMMDEMNRLGYNTEIIEGI